MNKIIICGNLTADPVCGQTPNNIPYCNFSVATTSLQGVTSYFRVTTWRNQAQACGNSLRKGNKVLVIGSIDIKPYENNGFKGVNAEVNAQEVEFLSPKNRGESNEQSQNVPQGMQVVDEDLPF